MARALELMATVLRFRVERELFASVSYCTTVGESTHGRLATRVIATLETSVIRYVHPYDNKSRTSSCDFKITLVYSIARRAVE